MGVLAYWGAAATLYWSLCLCLSVCCSQCCASALYATTFNTNTPHRHHLSLHAAVCLCLAAAVGCLVCCQLNLAGKESIG